ncbi:unnamed protein product, partial [Rotaria magnacalcarata]
NAPINFDNGAMITKGLGPTGQMVSYYNFDVQSTTPDEIFVLFRQGESNPVSGQLNIINTKPGETGYNDFWIMTKVTVPSDYVANTVTSEAAITTAGYTKTPTTTIVNCPVVPKGSTATKRLGTESNAINRGWYKDSIIYYFTFNEKALSSTALGTVPISPIYVTFNTDGDPSTGFKMENSTTMQTHNVIASIPSQSYYSPLWNVNVYANSAFGSVNNLSTARSSNII